MEENVDYSQILVPCRPSLDDQYIQLKPLQSWRALALGDTTEQMREGGSVFGLLGFWKNENRSPPSVFRTSFFLQAWVGCK